MDEYYCPNCGATLDDQEGFDPSKGYWQCTSCGKMLVDDDVNDGDTYEGIAWFCDGCGALLNKQSDFSDSYGTWVCTECGHKNGITEDDIVDDDEEDEDNDDEDENLTCPNCGAILNDQFCFAAYEDDWECTECGVHLHHDFSSSPYEMVYDDSDDDDDEDDDEEDEDDDSTFAPPHHAFSSSGFNSGNHAEHSERQHHKVQRETDFELNKKRVKAFIFNRKKINMLYDYEDLLGKNVVTVEILLSNLAFNNIKKIPIYDIYVDSPFQVGQVEQIVINGNSYFREGEQFPYDVEIILTYHVKRVIRLPFDEKSLRGMNYVTAGDKLQKIGFSEIYEYPVKLLKKKWLIKEGAVKKITIGTVYPFKKHNAFTYDTRILIEYYTYK